MFQTVHKHILIKLYPLFPNIHQLYLCLETFSIFYLSLHSVWTIQQSQTSLFDQCSFLQVAIELSQTITLSTFDKSSTNYRWQPISVFVSSGYFCFGKDFYWTSYDLFNVSYLNWFSFTIALRCVCLYTIIPPYGNWRILVCVWEI